MSKTQVSTKPVAPVKALPKTRTASKSQPAPKAIAKPRATLKPRTSPMPQEDPKSPAPFNLFFWLLLLVLSCAVGLGIVYLNMADSKATGVVNQPQEVPAASATELGEGVAEVAGEESGEEAGALTIEKYLIPEHGVIQIVATNGSDETVIAPQVMVDDAYWDFDVEPSTTIPAGGVVTYTLPYPWVAGELPEVLLVTSRGETIEGEVEPTIEISGETASAQ